MGVLGSVHDVEAYENHAPVGCNQSIHYFAKIPPWFISKYER